MDKNVGLANDAPIPEHELINQLASFAVILPSNCPCGVILSINITNQSCSELFVYINED